MIHAGENELDGVPVEVVRKRIRRINIRIRPDGGVSLSVPRWWATLREGEAFLKSKWDWVLKTRQKVLSRPAVPAEPVTPAERERLEGLLDELQSVWSARLGEPGVTWRMRRLKSIWGSCHWRKRVITYNLDLARVPRELVEYVVVHEFTHFKAHNHGPQFYALMDARLPGWQVLRRRLNRREYEPVTATVVRQAEFDFAGVIRTWLRPGAGSAAAAAAASGCVPAGWRSPSPPGS